MGEDQSLNLAAWFKKLLLERKFQGLVWENEAENTFRVPWSNQKKKDRLSSGEDSQLLIEWAKHKYCYKEGAEVSLTKWKTNLRCAINKCPDINRLRDRDTDFYLVCQFTLHHPVRTDSTLSSSSTTSQSEMDYLCAASVSPLAMSEYDFQTQDGINTAKDNIPFFLNDAEMSSLSNDSNYDNSFYKPELLSPDSNHLSCFSNMPGFTAAAVNEKQDDEQHDAAQQQQIPPNYVQQDQEQHYAAQQQQIPPNYVQHLTEQESERHIMIIEASYDIPQRPVMCHSIKCTSPCLRICSNYVSDTNLNSQMYEPHENIITIPCVESIPDLPIANKSKIKDIINNFQRGVSIKYSEHNILIERKSKVKVFATNEASWCHEIKRKASSQDPPNWVKIFDYEIFWRELRLHYEDQSNPCPKDYVLLTIGHHYYIGKASPLSTVLVCIKIRHVQAANDLKLISNGTVVSPDPMISGGDSLDKQIEEKMNNLNIC